MSRTQRHSAKGDMDVDKNAVMKIRPDAAIKKQATMNGDNEDNCMINWPMKVRDFSGDLYECHSTMVASFVSVCVSRRHSGKSIVFTSPGLA